MYNLLPHRMTYTSSRLGSVASIYGMGWRFPPNELTLLAINVSVLIRLHFYLEFAIRVFDCKIEHENCERRTVTKQTNL